MKLEDVDINKVYYFIYSNDKILSILVPFSVTKSGYGKNHFWTAGWFYDSNSENWYNQTGDWTIGNKSYIMTDKRLSQKGEHTCIASLFGKEIK